MNFQSKKRNSEEIYYNDVIKPSANGSTSFPRKLLKSGKTSPLDECGAEIFENMELNHLNKIVNILPMEALSATKHDNLKQI